MGTLDKQGAVTMQELLVSNLATADALTKLLIEKGLITEAEFTKQLSTDRAVYQAMLGKVRWRDGRATPTDRLPALAWKTLFGCLRETSCSRRPQGLPRAVHANKAFTYSIQI